MQDKAPRNRQRGRPRKQGGTATLVRPQRPPSQKEAPSLATGIGDNSASDSAPDYPNATGPTPQETWEQADARIGAELFKLHGLSDGSDTAERKPSHKAGGSKQQRIYETLVSYYALAGLGLSRWEQGDGMLIVANAEKLAESWMVAGKANPKIMRALEMVTVAGPYTGLIMVHVQLAFTLMDRHGANPFASLFARQPSSSAPKQAPAPVTSSNSPREPAPMPYVPVGPNAPTEAPASMPPYREGDIMVVPDEGLPAEIDVALREMARATGRPYNELRNEALVELAQLRMQQNGHRNVAPATLGAPIA